MISRRLVLMQIPAMLGIAVFCRSIFVLLVCVCTPGCSLNQLDRILHGAMELQTRPSDPLGVL